MKIFPAVFFLVDLTANSKAFKEDRKSPLELVAKCSKASGVILTG